MIFGGEPDSGIHAGLDRRNGICLPSFYFYGLLAGIKTTMLGVTAHAIKGMAAGAVAGGTAADLCGMALTSIVFPLGRALGLLLRRAGSVLAVYCRDFWRGQIV